MKNFKFSKNIFLIAVIVFLIYSIWDKIISFLNGTPFKRLNVLGSTFSDTTAKEKSEAIYLAMNGYGTDESAIYSILKGISLPNFNKIYNFFGKKYYDQQLGINGNPVFDFKLDLLGWLNQELSESELEHLKKIAPNVFV